MFFYFGRVFREEVLRRFIFDLSVIVIRLRFFWSGYFRVRTFLMVFYDLYDRVKNFRYLRFLRFDFSWFF